MKTLFSFLLFLFVGISLNAQPINDLHTTAKKLMKEGDYENANLVLYKLLLNEPNNIIAKKDFALSNYFTKNYNKSIEITKEILLDSSADDLTYQLLGLNYKAIEKYKECNELYKNAILKFPASGLIYSELAALNMLEKKSVEAIKNWEKGIEVDPNYSSNYYNAAMYYSQNNQNFWTIIYGEIFINLESYTIRTAEVKDIVFNGYKKILYLKKSSENSNNLFEKKILETLGNTNESITATTLSAIRTKFILNWFYNKNQEKFSFKLFDHQQYLIREGMFESYNQWLFGISINPVQYKIWVDAHQEEANSFKQLQESKVFKLIVGENYRN